MEKILFISHELFLDETRKEGGVRVCTLEFINLLKTRFEVVLFRVKYRHTLLKRIRIKLGLNIYDDYRVEDYRQELDRVLVENNIRFVFINMTNAMRFGSLIKNGTDVGGEANDKATNKTIDRKVILCSHGNETGDFLHEKVRFEDQAGPLKRALSSYALGSMLKAESSLRLRGIDLVLCVSPVEEQIENWLGAHHTFMVPRTISFSPLAFEPVLNRVGFFGDLSHWPNKNGILRLCEALSKQAGPSVSKQAGSSIELRLVGGPEDHGRAIAAQYPFVKYLGYLPTAELEKEVAGWSFFLNPVFYYSRGVSTKLAKALAWGLPVLSTIPGNRGYRWSAGSILNAAGPEQMAKMIIEKAGDRAAIEEAHTNSIKIAQSAPALASIMDALYPALEEL